MSYARPSLAALCLIAAACSNTPAPPGGQSKTLVILHTNDEHSHLIGFGPELDDYPAPATAGTGTIKGGVGRRAALLAQERTRATGLMADTLTVSAGDITMGTLMQALTTVSAPDFGAMKALGYDVLNIGNHEFDWGPDRLASAISAQAAKSEGAVPMVSSNIHFPSGGATTTLQPLFDETGADTTKPVHRSWVVTTAGGLKVGFVGIMGADAQRSAPYRLPVQFSLPASGMDSDEAGVMAKLFTEIQPVVDDLRNNKKVDLVVAVSHSGVNAPGDSTGEDNQIARNVTGIDVIVSGHSHTVYPATIEMNPTTNKPVLIQQAGQFGEYLGRIQLSIKDGKVTFDMTNTTILPVDDKIIADPAFNTRLDDAITTLEATKLPSSTQSFLEHALSEVTATAVVDNPQMKGDLYFYPLGTTAFDVIGQQDEKETPLMVLAADAMLTSVEAVAGPTVLAVQARGVVRADLNKGKSGTIAFGDVFRAFPLGISTIDGTVGYPLCRFAILGGELRAALEIVAGYAYSGAPGASGYFLVPAGLKFEYDTNRTPFTSSATALDFLDPSKGRVTKITLAKDHSNLDDYTGANGEVIWDVTAGGFVNSGDPTGLYVVTSSLYIAQFAAGVGVMLKNVAGTATVAPQDTIVMRSDGSELKDYESVASYIYAQSTANGGMLPARYNGSGGPRRDLCSGPLCKP
jgi:5'-nucleotidase / UDP-sugar diphosphatase